MPYPTFSTIFLCFLACAFMSCCRVCQRAITTTYTCNYYTAAAFPIMMSKHYYYPYAYRYVQNHCTLDTGSVNVCDHSALIFNLEIYKHATEVSKDQ